MKSVNYWGNYFGSAYWGLGAELRVRYHKDKSYIEFYRLGDSFEK